MQTVIVKLLSSQEIIAKLVNETPTELGLESPLMIQPIRNPQTQELMLGLVPFSFAGDVAGTVTINKAHVLCVLPPEEALSTQYLSAISGIMIAPAGSVPEAREDKSRNRLTLVE